MDWKEFLKPTLIKIFLFIVLISFSSFVYYIDISGIMKAINFDGTCNLVEPTIFSLPLYPISNLYSGCSEAVSFLINIPYLYVLSSIIITMGSTIKRNMQKSSDSATMNR